LTEKW